MSESYDTLKDLPRVPHAEGTVKTGMQTGVGGNPPDKKYISYGEPVDIAVAAANLRARVKGEKPIIAGGIDDEDERLYNKPEPTGPFSKMRVAQGRALTAGDVERIKSGGSAGPSGKVISGPRAVDGNAEKKAPGNLVSSYPDTPGQVDGRREGLFRSMGGPAGREPPQPEDDTAQQLNGGQPKVVYVDRPVEVEKVVEVEKETEASRWLRQRTRVMISTSETTFSVSAVAVVRSEHAVTVILPTSNDAMTFIPRTGARIKVQYKGSDPLDTVFTGAVFDIPELGILGLAFLIPRPADDAGRG